MVLFPTRKEICEDEMISQSYRLSVKSGEAQVGLQIVEKSNQ